MNRIGTYLLRLAAALLLLAVACRPPGSRPPVEKRFFDLAGFMEKEAQRLAAGSFVLEKDVEAGGRKETKRIAAPDWAHELKPFADCDINALSGANAYRADTVTERGGMTVAYTAVDPRVKVRSLAVRLRAGKVASLSAVRRTTNPYYNAETAWRYVPDSGFALRGYQKIIFKDADRVHIGALFRTAGHVP
jgi:hypothetical protein